MKSRYAALALPKREGLACENPRPKHGVDWVVSGSSTGSSPGSSSVPGDVERTGASTGARASSSVGALGGGVSMDASARIGVRSSAESSAGTSTRGLCRGLGGVFQSRPCLRTHVQGRQSSGTAGVTSPCSSFSPTAGIVLSPDSTSGASVASASTGISCWVASRSGLAYTVASS